MVLTNADARYFKALVDVRDVIGQEDLHFERLPEALEQLLDRCQQQVLFSVIAECLERLLGTSTLKRVKAIQANARNGNHSPTGGAPGADRPRAPPIPNAREGRTK